MPRAQASRSGLGRGRSCRSSQRVGGSSQPSPRLSVSAPARWTTHPCHANTRAPSASTRQPRRRWHIRSASSSSMSSTSSRRGRLKTAASCRPRLRRHGLQRRRRLRKRNAADATSGGDAGRVHATIRSVRHDSNWVKSLCPHAACVCGVVSVAFTHAQQHSAGVQYSPHFLKPRKTEVGCVCGYHSHKRKG